MESQMSPPQSPSGTTVPRSNWRDRSVVLRTVLLSAGLVLSLVGCGAMMPGAGFNTPEAASADGPGVTGDSVKVVFIATDLDAVQKTTGFTTESVGDQEAQIEALESWVNDNGGLGGKKMEAVYRVYDAVKDSPATEEQLCNQITQDDQAFAVVLTGQYQPNARPCYARANTLMLDAALMAADEEYYEELHPYLWTASFPEYGAFVENYVQVLKDGKFFGDSRQVGIIAADNDINRRVAENQALPLLGKMGIKASVAWIDTTDIGTLNTGLIQAATTFQGKKVKHVMFLGGSRLAAMFASVSGTTGFKARMAMSSFDNPSYFVNNPAMIPEGVTEGMYGIGFHPPQEVKADRLAFPTPQEKTCTDIYAASDVTFSSRESARVALPYCDAARLLKIGADGLDGAFNANNWADSVQKNGTDFVTASGFGGAIGTSHAAAGGFRVMEFDSECDCFTYLGKEKSFHADQ